jgi:hypothetical protein
LLVEVLGPAGSGKTTVATALATRDRAIVTDIPLPRRRTLPFRARTLVRSIPWRLRAPAGAGPAFDRRGARAMAYLEAWRHAIRAGRAPASVTVLDHGPVFRLAYLIAFGPRMTRTAGFHRWWVAEVEAWSRSLDLLVVLDAPNDSLLERIAARDRAHAVKGRPAAEGRLYLERYREAFETVLSRFAGAGGPDVVRIDTVESDLEQTVGCALAALTALATGGRRG